MGWYVRFVDELSALSSADESRMGTIHQDLGESTLGNMTVKVSRVQDVGQLGTTILGVRSKILVKLIQTLKLDITGRTLVSIRCLVHDSHCTMLLGRLLEKLKQVGSKKNVSEMVNGQVQINAI